MPEIAIDSWTGSLNTAFPEEKLSPREVTGEGRIAIPGDFRILTNMVYTKEGNIRVRPARRWLDLHPASLDVVQDTLVSWMIPFNSPHGNYLIVCVTTQADVPPEAHGTRFWAWSNSDTFSLTPDFILDVISHGARPSGVVVGDKG